jgi:hypothetical protein
MSHEAAVIDYLTSAIQLYDRLMAVPHVRTTVETLLFLSGTSGAFWFLSRVLGRVALAIHDSLDYSLAVLFAVSYNLALAVLFAGVMALAIFRRSAGSELLLGYQAAGFVFIYLVLSAAYSDHEGKIDEYSVVGYFGGLAAFLLCCVHSQWLTHPAVARAHGVVNWIRFGWAGKVALALSVLQGVLWGTRYVRRLFFWKSVEVAGKRRFFFDPLSA